MKHTSDYTVDMNNPYELTMEEMFLMGRFRADFINSMALNSNRDIESESQVVYVEKQRVFVKDADNGKQIA